MTGYDERVTLHTRPIIIIIISTFGFGLAPVTSPPNAKLAAPPKNISIFGRSQPSVLRVDRLTVPTEVLLDQPSKFTSKYWQIKLLGESTRSGCFFATPCNTRRVCRPEPTRTTTSSTSRRRCRCAQLKETHKGINKQHEGRSCGSCHERVRQDRQNVRMRTHLGCEPTYEPPGPSEREF